MNNYFGQVLYEYRQSKGFTQKRMLDFLHERSPLLSTLDAVTVSRWENGKTVPSLEKRIFILSILGMAKRYFYLESLTNRFPEGIIDDVVSKKFTKSNKLQIALTASLPDDMCYQLLYSNFELAPQEIREYFLRYNQDVDKICQFLNVEIGSWMKSDKVEGFFVHVPIQGDMFSELSGHINNMMEQIQFESVKIESCDALFLFNQINLTKKCFLLSNLLLFLTLLENSQYEKLYATVHDKLFLNLMLRFGAEIVCTYQTNEMKQEDLEHSQLIVIDRLKFISNKSVFEFFANVYNKLNRNNPDLLKQLRESNETRSNRSKAYC